MSESLENHVSRVYPPGPLAQVVNLGKVVQDGQEVRLWTFIDKDEVVVPGMTFFCPDVGYGPIQTSYTKKDENGNEVEVDLRVPKRQVFCYIAAQLDAPKTPPVTTKAVVTDAAREYAEKYFAARAKTETDPDEGPF
jgi:hypothetical protein